MPLALTLGVVPYLNAVPLLAGLEEDHRLVLALPSALAARLRRGEIDAGLVPVAEVIRGAGDGYLGRHGIASEGPVASVLLFLKKPLPKVHSVLLDPASRTSAALARHLVAQVAGGDVAFAEALEPGPDPAGAREDAVLVIGDRALEQRETWKGDVLDLGAEWTHRTALPFVFARWTARTGLSEGERTRLAERLDQAADEGLPRRAERARAWAAANGRDPKRAVEYVQRFVRYRIGPREEEGLARFAAIVRAGDEAATKERSHA